MTGALGAFTLDTFALQGSIEEKRNDLVFLAKTSEATERYEDMCLFMQEVVLLSKQSKQALTGDERNLLSVAYKNVVGARRSAWRSLMADDNKEQDDAFGQTYREQIEKELKLICDNIIDLLQDILIPMTKNNNNEFEVFYLKMAGDYYRYLAELKMDETSGQKAKTFYESADEIASKYLGPVNPIRLGLSLNYSVCYYEILGEQKKACEIARMAFDHALEKLDGFEKHDYKDGTLIIQLLRDNLALWNANEDDDEDDEDDEEQTTAQPDN